MLPTWVIYIGALAGLTGSLGYVRATITGAAVPNRASWALWALAPMVAFVAQMGEGVGLPALMTFMVGLGPALVLAASFVSTAATWRLTRFDYACASLSLAGLAIWVVSREAAFAIALAILADALAALPTLVKIWRHPETESATVYVGGTVNATLTMLTFTSTTLTWEAAAFPAYICLLGGTLLLMLALRRPAAPAPV